MVKVGGVWWGFWEKQDEVRGNRGWSSAKCAHTGWSIGGVRVVLVPISGLDLFLAGGEKEVRMWRFGSNLF
jgi:hypothetical protein